MNMPYEKSQNHLGAAAITFVHSMASILFPTCSRDSCSDVASINVHCKAECLSGSYKEAIKTNPTIDSSNSWRDHPFSDIIVYQSKACSSSLSSRKRWGQWSCLLFRQLIRPWYQGSPCDESVIVNRRNSCFTQTFGTTFSFFPWLYSDFATAVSSRWSVLGSSFCQKHSFSAAVPGE